MRIKDTWQENLHWVATAANRYSYVTAHAKGRRRAQLKAAWNVLLLSLLGSRAYARWHLW